MPVELIVVVVILVSSFVVSRVLGLIAVIAICHTHHHFKISLAAITVLPLYHCALVTTVWVNKYSRRDSVVSLSRQPLA
jgi:uncharacterized membrane protein YqjE